MKKVLSFVLILALVLGSFSFAFGLSDVTEATANSEAITVANDLGIVIGTDKGAFEPDRAVNRAEFATMITRALGVPDSALAGFSATSFKDTSGYGWAVKYLAFCESKGIMIGDGMGNVMPGRTINVNEAMTMVLRAVGYTENSALLVGTWPAKYVTVAQNLGLYDDVASMLTVDRGNAAQIIYNALTVVKVQVDADGQTTNVTDDPTMLDNLGGKFWNTVSGKNAFAVFTKADAETSVINTQKYVGAFVKAYANDDGDVIAIAEVGSTFLTGTYDATADEFTANDVDYSVNVGSSMTTTYKTDVAVPLTENAKFGVNGNITAGTSIAAIPSISDGAFTIAAKVSGKTIKDVYSVQEWAPETAFLFEADMLDDDAINGYNFTLDDNDDIDTSSFALHGVAKLANISKDNVVSVFLKNPNVPTSDIVKVEVGTETVNGKVTMDNDSKYTINGKEYKLTASINIAPTLGDDGTAYLNYNGRIAYWDKDKGSVDNYAIVTATYAAVGRDNTMMLLDKNGIEKEYVIASDVTSSGALPSVITEGSLVTFDLNKSGKVSEIAYLSLTTGPGLNINKAKTIYGNKLIDSDVVVFVEDGGDYSLGSFADLEGDTSLTAWLYYNDGKVKVFVVGPEALGAESTYAVFNSVFDAYNSDDDKVQYVKGFADNAAYTAYTDDVNVVTAALVTNTSVNVMKLKVNSAGVIVNAEEANSQISKVTGTVLEKDSNNLILVTSGGFATWCAIDTNASVYEFATNVTNPFSKGSLSSIKAPTTAVPTGTTVELWQLDSDSSVYDLVVIKK